MLIDPYTLYNNPGRLEEIEKASLRLVIQALYDYREAAQEIFHEESDLVADIGEDITREALDARYLFHSEYAVKQALFIDSKAEKTSGQNTATLQTSQFSMLVRQIRSQSEVEVAGTLPSILTIRDDAYITTTIFVKYNYIENSEKSVKELDSITVAALPNGILQEFYNPTSTDTIWLAGRNAPTRGEAFRVRYRLCHFNGHHDQSTTRLPAVLARVQ